MAGLISDQETVSNGITALVYRGPIKQGPSEICRKVKTGVQPSLVSAMNLSGWSALYSRHELTAALLKSTTQTRPARNGCLFAYHWNSMSASLDQGGKIVP